MWNVTGSRVCPGGCACPQLAATARAKLPTCIESAARLNASACSDPVYLSSAFIAATAAAATTAAAVAAAVGCAVQARGCFGDPAFGAASIRSTAGTAAVYRHCGICSIGGG